VSEWGGNGHGGETKRERNSKGGLGDAIRGMDIEFVVLVVVTT